MEYLQAVSMSPAADHNQINPHLETHRVSQKSQAKSSSRNIPGNLSKILRSFLSCLFCTKSLFLLSIFFSNKSCSVRYKQVLSCVYGQQTKKYQSSQRKISVCISVKHNKPPKHPQPPAFGADLPTCPLQWGLLQPSCTGGKSSCCEETWIIFFLCCQYVQTESPKLFPRAHFTEKFSIFITKCTLQFADFEADKIKLEHLSDPFDVEEHLCMTKHGCLKSCRWTYSKENIMHVV